MPAPQSLGTFVGRQHDVARAAAALRSGARLLSIVGPPGIGKTRLAEQVLAAHETSFAAHGGVWFCDVTDVRDEQGLLHAIASMWWPRAHVHRLGDDLLAELVARAEKHGRTLVVVDNFEHLVRFAPSIHELCKRASSLSVIVTSRERLAVPGEHVIEVEPLRCPSAQDGHEAIFASEAVTLLRERAHAAGVDVNVDASVWAAIARHLDGIPLAIELATARMRLTGVRDSLAALEQGRVLALGASRDRHIRHATLSAAIDRSWALLSDDEQTLLLLCSVFAGGFSLSALQSVASQVMEHADVVGLAAQLRDKSLLHSRDDHERLGMYLSIREYAMRKLDGEHPRLAERVRRAHAVHFAHAVRDFNTARLFQDSQPDSELRGRLMRDKANLSTAAVFAQQSTDGADAATLAELAIGITLLQCASTRACFDALDVALRTSAATGLLRARLLFARQALFSIVGRFEECSRDLDDILAIEDLPEGLRAFVFLDRGLHYRYRSAYRLALESHQSADALLATRDVSRLHVVNAVCIGRLHCDLRNPPQARYYNERARELARSIGDQWLEAIALSNLAHIEQEAGRLTHAHDLFALAISQFSAASEPQYSAVYSAALGDLHFERDDAVQARAHYELADPFFEEWPDHPGAGLLYTSRAMLEARFGDPDVAQRWLTRALRDAARQRAASPRLRCDIVERALRLRRAMDGADAQHAAEEVAAVRAWLAWLEEPAAADSVPDVAMSSLDARFLLRMLAKMLPPAAVQDKATLLIGRDAAWVRVGDADKIDLLRRGPLRRILVALIAHHRSGLSSGLDAATLIAAGWPDEKVLADAASTRLRVAVATLRKLGLRDVLLTSDNGYLIPSSVQVLQANS